MENKEMYTGNSEAERLSQVFDERMAPMFVGFTSEKLQAFKNEFVANQMDDYKEWYAWYVGELGKLMPEYGPELLRALYIEAVDDGEAPVDAFVSVVCCALERDF